MGQTARVEQPALAESGRCGIAYAAVSVRGSARAEQLRSETVRRAAVRAAATAARALRAGHLRYTAVRRAGGRCGAGRDDRLHADYEALGCSLRKSAAFLVRLRDAIVGYVPNRSRQLGVGVHAAGVAGSPCAAFFSTEI